MIKFYGKELENIVNDIDKFDLCVPLSSNQTLSEILSQQEIGTYTFSIEKGNPDLPIPVIEKNSSAQGICRIDAKLDNNSWFGWILLFDNEGYMWNRDIKNGHDLEWVLLNFKNI